MRVVEGSVSVEGTVTAAFFGGIIEVEVEG
jgi:hypothetical protein